jgi:isoquinoline 1-oxidoreductase alpha subunit
MENSMVSLNVNGRSRECDAEADTPLLWVLREDLGLRGTKFGCGAGLCGACTVHVDGAAMRSCQVALSDVAGKSIHTIEGLVGDQPDAPLHAVQAAWVAEQVPQCGYCQPGMIMAAAALLATNPHPTEKDIRTGITNICRCGTYPRIVQAVLRAAKGAA